MNPDNRTAIEPEKTPLFIGAGVSFNGSFSHTGPADEKAVILGELTGDMEWNGVLQVPRGGKVTVMKSLRCREIMVGGEIVGVDENVVIETGLLRLGESASVEVATVSVPPGGLEQSRGSVINARLRMSSENAFAQSAAAAPAPRLLPVLTAVGTCGQEDRATDGTPAESPPPADLEQIETRTQLAA